MSAAIKNLFRGKRKSEVEKVPVIEVQERQAPRQLSAQPQQPQRIPQQQQDDIGLDDDEINRLQDTSPEALRHLRDLIRTRSRLDSEILRSVPVRRPDRPYVERQMEVADAVLTEIFSIVNSWTHFGNNGQPMWSEREWKMAQTIKERLLSDGKHYWKGNPPWNDDEEEDDDDKEYYY